MADLYKIRQTPSSETWEIYNSESDQVVQEGAPSKEKAERLCERMNEMVKELEEGED